MLFQRRMFWKVRAMPSAVTWSGVGSITCSWMYFSASLPLYIFFIFPVGWAQTMGLPMKETLPLVGW